MAQTPLYYELIAQPQPRDEGVKRALVNLEIFEVLLKRNGWPLGNQVDIIDRHLEYQRWYPGDYHLNRDEPVARAYHTLTRLLTRKDIAVALSAMRDIRPWRKAEDFGDVQGLQPVAVPAPAPVVVVPPAVVPPVVVPPPVVVVPPPAAGPEPWSAAGLPGYDSVIGFKSTKPEQWIEWRYRAFTAKRPDVMAAIAFVKDHAQLLPRIHDALSLSAFIAQELNGWNGFNSIELALRTRLDDVERATAYILSDARGPAPALPESPTDVAIGLWVDNVEDAGHFYADYLYITELSTPEYVALLQQVERNGSGDALSVRRALLLEQAYLSHSTQGSPLTATLRDHLARGLPSITDIERLAAQRALPAEEAVVPNVIPPLVQEWVDTADDRLFLTRSAAALAAFNAEFPSNRIEQLLGREIFNGGFAYLVTSRTVLKPPLVVPVRIDDLSTIVATEDYHGFLLYRPNHLVTPLRLVWQRLLQALHWPNDANRKAFDEAATRISRVISPKRIALGELFEPGLVRTEENRAILRNVRFEFQVPRLAWLRNSCWLDATLLSLFIHGNCALARWFLDANEPMTGYSLRVALTFDDKTTEIIKPCPRPDMERFYNTLLADVIHMLTPKPALESCELRVRSLWNTCVASPVREGEFGSAELAMLSLQRAFFRERCLFDEQSVAALLVQHHVDGVKGETRINLAASAAADQALLVHVFSTGWANEYRPGWKGTFIVEAPAMLYGGTFALSSVVVGSFGHYTVLVRSPYGWYDINVQPKAQGGTIVTEVYAALPEWATTINAANLDQRKPAMYVYLRT